MDTEHSSLEHFNLLFICFNLFYNILIIHTKLVIINLNFLTKKIMSKYVLSLNNIRIFIYFFLILIAIFNTLR